MSRGWGGWGCGNGRQARPGHVADVNREMQLPVGQAMVVLILGEPRAPTPKVQSLCPNSPTKPLGGLYDKPSNSKPQPHLQAQTRPKPRRLHWRHKSGICRIKEDDLRCPFSSGSSRRAHAPCKDERSRQCAESRTFDLILYHRTLRRTALSAYVFGCK